ncbi:TPA: NUDIX hydrolase [Streptococcus pyogenes]|uniref:NUDIX hydrolase n=1 Tax=Streptococcus pyogenes TaxID=1314 RepID=UPI0010A17AA2|nr:NUDIX hydrolase [Streptococcus pyogenes]VGS27787.1 ADP-ribose pyrophosphatase [Streptococcus pyogenes]VGS32326.1 ADP-ribose pyrophosphatase [Streptococcus pyogenes]VGS38626.1 ADP-ribose pyrophosphatase [Streptococcus pyogenes]VGT34101.1 ADP-ribose pyrophosphatase [Streptococcus pyogenes]VGT36345.1 ADP-ribose pyrophosphatase [Streptococcus pyogenes]
MKFEEKTLKRQTVFDGHIFKVVVDDVELPNNLGQSKRELIFHRGAVAVLAITPERKIVLVKQYRKAIECVSYEIPAGKLEIGEEGSKLKAAARELEEETAYTGTLTFLYEFYTAIGFCNEKITLFLATDLTQVANPKPQDDDEVIEVLELTYQECMDLVAQGKLADAKTLIALQYYALHFGGEQ